MRIRDSIRVADEVWIATALLHQEQPNRESFSVAEIVDRVALEQLTRRLRAGVAVHVYQHCVANHRPNPGSHRMLYATAGARRRLFRSGDDYHPYREGGKTAPNREDIPEAYRKLVDWYERDYFRRPGEPPYIDRTQSVWERIHAIWDRVPAEEKRKLPQDGAECHDYYIRGVK